MLGQWTHDVKKKKINVSSPDFKISCDTVQQKQDTDSPMSNNLHYIHNPKLLAHVFAN